MGFFDQVQQAIKPHAERASAEFSFHMAALHNRLAALERATIDAGRGDIGDHWQRFVCKRKFTSGEEFELGVVPPNEIWLIQSLASDGVQEKSPAFVLLASGVLLESVLKEGVGFEGIGGNQIAMKGERVVIVARAEGSINCTLTVIRRLIPGAKVMTDYGRNTEVASDRNTHEISRDAIGQRLGQSYVEPVPAVVGTGRQG